MPISELTFQAAVSKVCPICPRVLLSRATLTGDEGYSLKLERQTGTTLQPLQKEGISQVIYLNGVAHGQGSNVKMRWRLSYKLGGDIKQEQGEIPTLGVA